MGRTRRGQTRILAQVLNGHCGILVPWLPCSSDSLPIQSPTCSIDSALPSMPHPIPMRLVRFLLPLAQLHELHLTVCMARHLSQTWSARSLACRHKKSETVVVFPAAIESAHWSFQSPLALLPVQLLHSITR